MKVFPFQNRRSRGPKGKGGNAREKRPWDLHRLRALMRMHGKSIRRFTIGTALVVILMLLYMPPSASKGLLLAEGQIAKENILAPFDFPVLKSEDELDKERTAEARKVLPVVRESEETTESIKGRVRDFFLQVESIIDEEIDPEERQRRLSELEGEFTESAANVLLDLTDETRLRQEVVRYFDEVLARGVLTDKKVFEEADYNRLSVIRDGEEYALGLDRFLDLEEYYAAATEWARTAFGPRQELVTAFFEVSKQFGEANLFYDVTETSARREARRASVSPYTELYLKDQKIIGAHERVTKRHMRILESMETKVSEERLEAKPWKRVYPHFGRLLAVLAVMALFLVFLQRNRPRIYERDNHLVLLAIIALIGFVLTFFMDRLGLSPFLMPITLVAMLGTLLFDDRVGMALSGAYLVCVALLEGLTLPVAFTMGIVGATAVYGVSGLRERKSFWISLSYIGAAYIVAISAADFLHLVPSIDTLQKIGYGLLSAFVCAGLTMIVLPLFESLFRVTTNITLLELSDLNQPLLKNLSLFAPGTYHHSIMVGNLSEAACERIGAHSLLARVGGYYHDIGKMSKPEYFVENQISGVNKHDKLSPKISALILISHVREGIEMGRKEGLPDEIIDAIGEHHGTTLMAFFYDKAMKTSPSEVLEADFKYPGPRPRTKENAVIMLADVAEASVRALDEPTPTKIRQRIEWVTRAKFDEGQLDECDLTFRELRLIQESFIPILTSSMHSRIRYPDETKSEEARLAVGDYLRKPAR